MQIEFCILIPGQAGIRSRFAGLTILVPPEPPKINQGDFMVTTEDREIELECISVGGKPAAEVSTSQHARFSLQITVLSQLEKRRKDFQGKSFTQSSNGKVSGCK
jgi:hypothetical protein